ncbi:MAG: class I SAM-dependent methyltransferase [Xenococcaceae cyanobacterium]
MVANAQTFWLENLKLADRYNSWILSQMLPHLGNAVLEIGCGNGNFTMLLAGQCSRVVAVDIDEEYVRVTKTRVNQRSGVEVLAADATQFKWHQPFDNVVLLDVLEHIENDVEMLARLRDSLKPGGKIIIKVPALNCLYSPMDRSIGHYRRYNKQTLSNTLSQANFLQPSLWYFNLAGILGWWLNGQILGRTTPASAQVDLFNRLVPVLSTIEAKIKPPLGLSLFAVATKI